MVLIGMLILNGFLPLTVLRLAYERHAGLITMMRTVGVQTSGKGNSSNTLRALVQSMLIFVPFVVPLFFFFFRFVMTCSVYWRDDGIRHDNLHCEWHRPSRVCCGTEARSIRQRAIWDTGGHRTRIGIVTQRFRAC